MNFVCSDRQSLLSHNLCIIILNAQSFKILFVLLFPLVLGIQHCSEM